MRRQCQHDGVTPRLLSDMAAREFDRLLESAAELELPAGKMLISEGLCPKYLFVLMDGTVELFIRRGRRESSISLIEGDTPFVVAAVVKNAPYLMSARTVTDARILCISAPLFRAAMRRDNGLALATASALSDAYRHVVRQLRSHRLHSAQMRLAHYLVGLHNKKPGAHTLHLEITKRRLASLLGLKPESLSRLFASLNEYGVHVEGEWVTVTDFQLLEDLAQYDPNLDTE